MSPILVSILVLLSLIAAIWLGRRLRLLVLDDQLTDETKDVVKLAIGLIGTMTALLLGLLVSSAKSSYDSQRTQVIEMAAKVSFLGRVLSLYGPDADATRAQLRAAVDDSIRRLWPNERHVAPQLSSNIAVGDSTYFTIETLVPRSEAQQKLKGTAESDIIDLAQRRTLLVAQSGRSVSTPILLIVISWLILTFAGFGLLTPSNVTSRLALVFAAFAVTGAIFLLLELDQPFNGIMRIPSTQMINALNDL